MRIPGIGNIRNLSSAKARNKAMDMLKKAGIKKSARVIRAEYEDYCDSGDRSPKDKQGFLSVMNMMGDDEAKAWIDQERTHLDKIMEGEENEKKK